NCRGSDVVLYDLAHGNQRHLLGGDSRLLEAAIFTLGFALWSVAWGIVAKRERRRQPMITALALPALMPPTARPVPRLIAWKWQATWTIAMIVLSLSLVAGLEVTGGQSPLKVILDMLGMLAIMLGAAILLAVVLSWIAFFVVGPHRLTLVRLRQI